MSGLIGLGSDLGRDIKFDFDSMDISTDGSGISTVDGKANLSQAISLRLTTPVGSLPFHVNFGSGLSQLLGRSNSPGIEQIGKMYVGQALMREPRIEYVESIEITGSLDTVVVRLSVYSIGGENIIETRVGV